MEKKELEPKRFSTELKKRKKNILKHMEKKRENIRTLDTTRRLLQIYKLEGNVEGTRGQKDQANKR